MFTTDANQIIKIDLTIRRKQLLRDQLESCLTGGAIRYDKDKVQTTPEDHMAATLAKVADLDREIRRLSWQKAELVESLSERIEALDDETEKTVLTAYYLAGLRLSEVAEIISRSYRQTRRIRARALSKIPENVP